MGYNLLTIMIYFDVYVCVLWTCPPHYLNTFLLSDTRCYRLTCAFPAPALELAISLRSFSSFCREWYLKAKIQALDALIATGHGKGRRWLFPVNRVTDYTDIYTLIAVPTYAHTYIAIPMYIYSHTYVYMCTHASIHTHI